MFGIITGFAGAMIILGAVTAFMAFMSPASAETDDSGTFTFGIVGMLIGVVLMLAATQL